MLSRKPDLKLQNLGWNKHLHWIGIEKKNIHV
jgi:hypothetical protein